MIKVIHLMILFTLTYYSCNTKNNLSALQKWKNEIIQTEEEFALMAQQQGIEEAFLTYAADDVVLMRDNNLIIGKESLKAYFNEKNENSRKINLNWDPDFVDVSASGELGYTYGKYIYTITDSLGIVSTDTGIFHTVWKRQCNGEWRFVWD